VEIVVRIERTLGLDASVGFHVEPPDLTLGVEGVRLPVDGHDPEEGLLAVVRFVHVDEVAELLGLEVVGHVRLSVLLCLGAPGNLSSGGLLGGGVHPSPRLRIHFRFLFLFEILSRLDRQTLGGYVADPADQAHCRGPKLSRAPRYVTSGRPNWRLSRGLPLSSPRCPSEWQSVYWLVGGKPSIGGSVVSSTQTPKSKKRNSSAFSSGDMSPPVQDAGIAAVLVAPFAPT